MDENKKTRGLVSVVMPVYNVASCVGYSITSILNQSYPSWELLIVNDGSTDASGEVCDAFAQRDSRIKVFHIANAGVSNARNLGIYNSSGEYLMFCDSDDLISPDFMSIMIHHMDNACADIARCYMKSIDESVHSFIPGNNNLQWKVYGENDKSGLPAPMYDVVWGKLYRRSIIVDNGISFDKRLNRGEDTLFACQTTLCSSRIIYSENQLVNYRMRPYSLMRSKPSLSLFIQSVLKYHQLSSFIDKNRFDKNLCDHLKNEALICVAQELVRSTENPNLFESNYKKFRSDTVLRHDLRKVIPLLPKRIGLALIIILNLRSSILIKKVGGLINIFVNGKSSVGYNSSI